MHGIKKILLSIGAVILIAFPGCVNLEKVADFSSNSTKSLQAFQDLNYSFTIACREVCEIDRLQKISFTSQCDCEEEKVADSLTLVMFSITQGYFDGLAKLSNKELTDYNLDPLAASLKEGDFGGVKIDKRHVDAFGKISTTLTKAITDGYRRKKLALYIGDANNSIRTLLDGLKFILVSNLAKRLDTQKERIRFYYQQVAEDMGKSRARIYDYKRVIEDYNAAISLLESKKMRLQAFGKLLTAISEGHQNLFDNRNKLSASNIQAVFSASSSSIKDIMNELNKLKNQE